MSLTLGQLSGDSVRTRLAAGLRLRVGPFNVALKADDDSLAEHMATFYPDYAVLTEDAFAHAGVHAQTRRPRTKPWTKRGIIWLDDGAMFTDFGPGEALPYIEWAINWCIATRCHYLLMLHAAVVEKRGLALILPGLPGAGKSTLCTYLAHHGWRLLSDEFCLMRPRTIDIIPFPRLVPLKNESIDVIAAAIPGVRMGPRFEGTRKGTVAHVSPPSDHATCTDTAVASLVVTPRYVSGERVDLSPMAPAQCFVELSKNAFNYQILGRDGFDTVARLTASAPAFNLRYGTLEHAAEALDALLEAHYPSAG